MALFRPDAYFFKITQIPFSFFQQRGIRLVLLDVDNTLTTHDNPVPAKGVTDWLEQGKKAGISFSILSNNRYDRVKPFADALALPFVSKAAKPLSKGVREALSRFQATKEETAIIGDQLFTDMLCGNLSGICSVLVVPYQLETRGFLKIKRIWERPFLRRYQSMRKEKGS